MNDEFLHRLRKEPPPAFARRLHARLMLQEPERAPPPRSRMLRSVVLAFLVAGSAYAGAYLAMSRWPVFREVVNVPRHASAPQPIVPVEAPATAPAASGGRSDFPFVEGGVAKTQASPSATDRTPAPVKNSFVVPAPRSASRGQSSVPIPAMRGVPATRDILRIVTAAPVASVVRQMTYWLDDPIRQPGSQTERVESGEDFRTFCKGVGLEHPDIDAAARRISNAEFQSCLQNGVDQIVELKLGYQAIVVARTMAGGPQELSPRDIFLGLARQVPDPADRTRLIDNPHRTWDQINPRLENQYIEVYGPGRGTPLYSDFMSILMEAGCNAFPWIEALRETDSILHNSICHTLRQDGVYVESLSNAELIQQKLGASPNAVAITTYAFYTTNQNALIGNVLGHVDPTLENISAGTFPGSRTIYLYVKKEHLRLVPPLRRFVYDGVSDRFIGSGGPLERAVGLIPLDDADRKLTREIASELRELKLP